MSDPRKMSDAERHQYIREFMWTMVSIGVVALAVLGWMTWFLLTQ
jgi:HAMP domain-containing protein